jgi:hypothetical protein
MRKRSWSAGLITALLTRAGRSSRHSYTTRTLPSAMLTLRMVSAATWYESERSSD